MSVAACVAPATDLFLAHLVAYSGLLTQLVFDRNTTDESAVTLATLRPDCCIWFRNALVFKGEDKSDKRVISEAIAELGAKMASRWNILTMGSLPFLLCYASCGPRIQFCVVMRESNMAVTISEEFNLLLVRSMAHAVVTGRQ